MLDRYWNRISDADSRAIALYERHYSFLNRHNFKSRPKHSRAGIGGAGSKCALLTTSGDALFVWRYFLPHKLIDPFGKFTGPFCTVFRNEGTYHSSSMILEAEEWAWWKWPGETLHTFIDPTSVASPNPGYCFKKAGWKRRKDLTTKRGLHVLEKSY